MQAYIFGTLALIYIELATRHRLDNAAIGLILHVARLLGLSFGVHLATLATSYGLDMEDELASILRAAPDDETPDQ